MSILLLSLNHCNAVYLFLFLGVKDGGKKTSNTCTLESLPEGILNM